MLDQNTLKGHIGLQNPASLNSLKAGARKRKGGINSLNIGPKGKSLNMGIQETTMARRVKDYEIKKVLTHEDKALIDGLKKIDQTKMGTVQSSTLRGGTGSAT